MSQQLHDDLNFRYALMGVLSEPRPLSEVACRAVFSRVNELAQGGGYTGLYIQSARTGNVRWARNQISTSGDIMTTELHVAREIHGERHWFSVDVVGSEISDEALAATVRRAERAMSYATQQPRDEMMGQGAMIADYPLDPATTPNLWSTATDQLTPNRRTTLAQTLAQSSIAAGMLSAGYLEVGSQCRAVYDNAGHSRYFAWTKCQYSVTVRDPSGLGSGWAGVDHYDWAKIDASAITKTALDKCLSSRNPSRVEPGRYTVILEPQAVSDLVAPLIRLANRFEADIDANNPFHDMIGKKIADPRVHVSSDPMDPVLGYPPWVGGEPSDADNSPDPFLGQAMRPITWIDNGIVTDLSYNRKYALANLRQPHGTGGSSSFTMRGGTVSIEEMIATTKRGLFVTRFDRIQTLTPRAMLMRGYTRDGLWLIENGKISKPAMNMAFTDSPLFVLNKIEQLGVPTRVFRPAQQWMTTDWVGPASVMVPAIKATDFSFTALSDAV